MPLLVFYPVMLLSMPVRHWVIAKSSSTITIQHIVLKLYNHNTEYFIHVLRWRRGVQNILWHMYRTSRAPPTICQFIFQYYIENNINNSQMGLPLQNQLWHLSIDKSVPACHCCSLKVSALKMYKSYGVRYLLYYY